MNPDEMITKKIVVDDRTDTVFTASYRDKTIKAPDDGVTIGVKGDHKSRRLIFKLLELPDEYNLLTAPRAQMQVQYTNANRETGRSIIRAEDGLEEVVQEDGTKCLVVPWLIPSALTKARGSVQVQLCCTARYDTDEVRHWHLSPIELEIKDSFEVEDDAYDVTDQGVIDEVLDALASNDQKLKDLENAFTSLPSGGGSLPQELTALKTRMTKVEGEKLSVSAGGQLYAKKTEMDALSGDVSRAETSAREALTEAESAKEIAQSNYTTISNIDSRLMTVEDTLAHGGGSTGGDGKDWTEEINALKEADKNLTTAITNANDTAIEAMSAATTASEKADGFANRIKALEDRPAPVDWSEQIGQIQIKADGAQATANSAKTLADNLSTRVDTLEQNGGSGGDYSAAIKNLQDADKTLGDRIATLENGREVVDWKDQGSQFTLDPAKLYWLGSRDSFTYETSSPEAGAEYHFAFSVGATAPEITHPRNVVIPDDFAPEAKTTVEVSILYVTTGIGLLAWKAWPNE